MATEMSSGGINQRLGETDSDWLLQHGYRLLQLNGIDFLVAPEIEVLEAFDGPFVLPGATAAAAAAAARFGFTGGGSGVPVYIIGRAADSQEQAPGTSNEAMIAIHQFPAFDGNPIVQYPVFDGNPIFQAHAAGRGGSNVVPVLERNDGAMVYHFWDGALVHRVAGRPYAIGGRGGPIILGIGEESGSFNFNGFIMPAQASPGLTVLGRGGYAIEPLLRDLIEAIRGHNGSQAALDEESGSFNFNGFIMPAEAISGLTVLGRGGYAIEPQLRDLIEAIRGHNGDIMRPAMRGHTDSQAVFEDETGGRFLAIHINPSQQADNCFRAENGPGDIAQRALQSAFGGLVPLCLSALEGILKGGSPGYIKAAAYAGMGLITAFTFVGLVSKERANAAVRVVASTAIAAASTTIVYSVSENVYIKCICGIIGAVATLATAAIDW